MSEMMSRVFLITDTIKLDTAMLMMMMSELRPPPGVLSTLWPITAITVELPTMPNSTSRISGSSGGLELHSFRVSLLLLLLLLLVLMVLVRWSHVLAGTRQYTPPEWFQRRSYLAEPLTVWQVGVLLYNLLAGQCPFQTTDEIVKDEPPHIPHGISSNCKDFLRQCLSKEPLERPTLRSLMLHSWLHARTTRASPGLGHCSQEWSIRLRRGTPLARRVGEEINAGDWSLQDEDQVLVQLKPVQQADYCTWVLGCSCIHCLQHQGYLQGDNVPGRLPQLGDPSVSGDPAEDPAVLPSVSGDPAEDPAGLPSVSWDPAENPAGLPEASGIRVDPRGDAATWISTHVRKAAVPGSGRNTRVSVDLGGLDRHLHLPYLLKK
ncbi:hypothetical protein CRUP_005051 [Coryphaenoides rupestris]|nr:hypothetical protein CRUP_005051 [Coryphaenoides rupestris]